MELAAVHAAWLMNCWVTDRSSPLTADDLLGREKPNIVSVSDFNSAEEFQDYLREHGGE